MKKKMKVLVVATSRKTRGGITSVIKAHEQGMQWNEFHCKWIQTHRDGNVVRKLYYFVRGLMEYVILLPFYDLVHVHFSEPLSAFRKSVFVGLAKLQKKKVVIHFHSFSAETTVESKYKSIYHYLFKTADCSIVLSNYWKKVIDEAFHDERINKKIVVVYNPCMPILNNGKQSSIDGKFTNMGCDLPCKNIILYAGTINERKGYSDLLLAFGKIAESHRDWMLLFAGNGEIDKGKRLALQLNIQKQVLWLGWVDGAEKDCAFREATVFCLPSYAEGFPMGVLDAWSYGLPVVTTPVGGIPDVAIDGENMLLFKPGDIDALSKKLERIMDDSNLRKSISVESIKLANGLFNITTCNKAIEKIYRKLLKQNIYDLDFGTYCIPSVYLVLWGGIERLILN